MNEILEQLKKIWSELGVSQRVSLGLTSLLILVVSIGLLMWASKPDLQLLYGKLESTDVSEVVSYLNEKSIPHEVRAGGNAIYVPSDKVYSIRMDLASQGVPSGGGVGFEIFDQSNFGISDFIQRTNYMRAMQGELARTISQLNGVRSARVMIVVPENKILAEANKTTPTASVFVDTGGMRLREESVNSIRFIVANSVEGLDVNEVAVVDGQGNVLSQDLASDGAMGAASGQMRLRQSIESYYAMKIESMLSRVVGSGNVVARVAVDITSEASTTLQELYDPSSQVVRNQTVTENSTKNQETGAGQVVGLQANDDGAREGGGPLSSAEETRKNKIINYEINRSTVETVKGPGQLEEITASVLIAKKVEDQNGTMTAIDRTEEEMEVIRNIVSNAIGLTGSEVSNITVEEIEFQVSDNGPEDTSMAISLYPWVGIAKNFVAVGVSVGIFFIFLRMLKKNRPSKMSFEVMEQGGAMGAAVSGNAKDVTPKPTADLLNELIKQKPDNVSTAIKQWVEKDSD